MWVFLLRKSTAAQGGRVVTVPEGVQNCGNMALWAWWGGLGCCEAALLVFVFSF